MSRLSSLSLTNFRSYESLDIRDFHPRFVVFVGPNGVGKTNILEAISLLSPGRGLRGAALHDLPHAGLNAPWGVSARLATDYGEILLGTGADSVSNGVRRDVFIQGVKAKSQTELSNHIRCVWLTPQMDRLFIDPATTRRKFLDRLVFTHDPAHAGRMRRYETALSQRSKLLKEGQMSGAWLDSLESQMAESASAIAASRCDFTLKLQAEIDIDDGNHFPRARLNLDGDVERSIQSKPSLAVEDELKQRWRDARLYDAEHGGSLVGVHRTDLDVYFASKNMPAHQSSTGEQKSLLIGLILAQARFLVRMHQTPPVILLDEVAAHLDEDRRESLYEKLDLTGAQIFLTGTDFMLFDRLKSGQKFGIKSGGVVSL